MESSSTICNPYDGILFFLEVAPDAIVIIDLQGTIVTVNKLALEMFDYKKEELIGKKFEILFSKTSKNFLDQKTVELLGIRKNKTEFFIEISLSPMNFNEEQLQVSIIRDISARKKMEAKFQGLLESAPDGIVVVDTKGMIALVNSQTEKLFGFSRDELIGSPVEILVPEKYKKNHVGFRDEYIAHPNTRPMGAGRLLSGRKKDGSDFPVEISLSPLETEQGLLITSIVRDISERRQVEEQLKANLREKEALLKEIHHRVKNNLQVTSSLLSLQSAHVDDKKVKSLFLEGQNRIKSMALVHEKLYQKNDLSRINFLDYAESLVGLLIRSYGSALTKRIKVKVEGDDFFLSIDNAIPCGLILNELVSNCFKHAFPGERSGSVLVIIKQTESHNIMIQVLDNGVGVDSHFSFEKLDSLGLQLVKTLVSQINGSLDFKRDNGLRVTIQFNDGVGK